MLFLYNTRFHPKGPFPRPTFYLKEERLYTTVHHSDGADPNPWYDQRDGKLFPTEHHPQKAPAHRAWYSIQDGKVYADEGHPHGKQPDPWFEIRGPEGQEGPRSGRPVETGLDPASI